MSIDNTWPQFLDQLHADPESAAKNLYNYTIGYLRECPPRIYASIPEDHRPDLAHDVVVHCIKDDFRVLRQYVNRGKPFAAWFYFIVRNTIMDALRKAGRNPETVDLQPDDVGAKHRANPGPSSSDVEKQAEFREMLDAVYECMKEIDDYCRLLLRMAADEYLPREMVRVLRWSADKAKKVSNDLGYCRKKLEALLIERDISIDFLKSLSRK